MNFTMTKHNEASIPVFPENYFKDKYGLSPTHSEVFAATPYFVGNQAVDIGCGRGRNTLYLAQRGYHVEAFDANPYAVQILDQIIAEEGIDTIQTAIKDLNHEPRLSGQYDVLVCTVVMMFLEPETIPILIEEMQKATKPGGLNVIVCAMNTPKYPMQPDFRFGFKEGELRQYYTDWEFLKYNEDLGNLHRRDAEGNLLSMQFATMIAKKPA